MKQIADAPWIREAETIGYPVGEDWDYGDYITEYEEEDEE